MLSSPAMLKRTFAVLGLAFALSLTAHAQKPTSGDIAAVKATVAYADVLLRKTEVQADLDAFGQDYTETNPKILDLKAEFASLEASSNRLLTIKAPQLDRLTDALGKMM